MKNWVFYCFLIALAASAAVTGCYYDNEEELYPDTGAPCDTANITYSLTIVPILQSRCYLCHANSLGQLNGNVFLEDYQDVKVYADNGKLVGSIKHAPGFIAMPKDLAKIPDCEITQIEKWVNDGAPNN